MQSRDEDVNRIIVPADMSLSESSMRDGCGWLWMVVINTCDDINETKTRTQNISKLKMNIMAQQTYLPITDEAPLYHATADSEAETSTVSLTSVEEKITEPKMHRVLLHNDDYTPMEFVVAILESYFNKSEPQATQIMLDVHKKGVGICGVFTKEIAETKTVMVTEKAKMHKYPLRCTHEEEAY